MGHQTTTYKSFIAPEVDKIIIVGTGGTGSYLAAGLAKMVAGYKLDVEVVLVDPDVVEERNIYRQSFLAHEIGYPKSEVLANRLNEQFGTSFSYVIGRDKDINCHHNKYSPRKTLLVTCVDNLKTRKALKEHNFWLDTGNGLDYGQAVFGTVNTKGESKKAVKDWDTTLAVTHLPNPYIKLGMGRLKEEAKSNQPSCADMPFAEQGCLVNEWSAQAALAILHQILIKGEVTTPAIWFDFSKGRLTPARITKEYMDI